MPSLYVNCQGYAELVSKKMDQPLTLWEKALMKIHEVVCPPCENVEPQFETIAEACRHLPSDEAYEKDASAVLPQSTCDRIKAALKKAHETSSA